MERAVWFFQSFDGGDALAARFIGQVRASAHGRAIDQDRASAANLDFARNFRAVEVEGVAQNFGESVGRLAVNTLQLAVQSKLQIQLSLQIHCLESRVLGHSDLNT